MDITRGRDPQPIIDMARTVFQDLADVDPTDRRAAIAEIQAALSAYVPEETR